MKSIYAMLFALFAAAAQAQVVTYDWPEQAVSSERYRVFVKAGNSPEREVNVVLTRASPQGDYRAAELEGRTFSFASMSFAPTAGPLTVRAVKNFGAGAGSVTIHPRSLGIHGERSADGSQVVFRIDQPATYVSVHFDSADNRTAKEHWIKHALCVFVDPVERDVPDTADTGVAVYSPSIAPELLRSAKVIYFPAGYHNLRKYGRGGIIDRDGQLLLQDKQSLYLAGGAFVEGIVGAAPGKCSGQRVYGRGILSGRQYLWQHHPDHHGPAYRQLLEIGNKGRIDGVTLLDSPLHGVVGGMTRIVNFKLLGWHCNNDGIRVGPGSEISHSFVRAVDDHFYNFNIHVHDVVLWAGHNGAILTYGWGGEGTYNSGASLFEDIDIIHPEWKWLGNNNGLVASQVNLDYRPYGYGGKTTTVMRNIRVEGVIPGLVNLKPLTKDNGKTIAQPVPDDKVGYLGDLVLENINIDSQAGKSRIAGHNAFFVRNVQFKNVRIGGAVVTEENKAKFFDIDAATTRDISFSER